MYVICIFEHLASGMATAALFTMMMDATRPHAAGTNYTAQASVVVLATGIASALSGFSAQKFGYPAHFGLAAALCLAATGLVLMHRAQGAARGVGGRDLALRRCGIGDAAAVNQEGRGVGEEAAQGGGAVLLEGGLVEGGLHQRDPAIPGGEVDGEGHVARSQAWVAALGDVALGAAEAADQEVAEAPLGARAVGPADTSARAGRRRGPGDKKRRPGVRSPPRRCGCRPRPGGHGGR